MTETIDTSSSHDVSGKLDKRAVLAAVTGLCGSDCAAAAVLRKGIKRLVTTGNWAAETKRLEVIIASDCKPAGAQ